MMCKKIVQYNTANIKFAKSPHRIKKASSNINALSSSTYLPTYLHTYPPTYLHIYRSTALCWTSAAFSVSYSYTQSVGFLRRRISPSQGRYLHTEQHKHRINAYTNIHTLSGIRTHDPSVRANEDSSCLRPRGHCDRLSVHLHIRN
jgi:hypothetical protein